MLFSVRSSLRTMLLAATSSLLFCNPTHAASNSVLKAGARAFTSPRALSLATKAAAGASLLIANIPLIYSSCARIMSVSNDRTKYYEDLLSKLPNEYKQYKDASVLVIPDRFGCKCSHYFHPEMWSKAMFIRSSNLDQSKLSPDEKIREEATLRENFAHMLPYAISAPRRRLHLMAFIGLPLSFQFGLYTFAQKILFPQNKLFAPTTLKGFAGRAATLIIGGGLVLGSSLGIRAIGYKYYLNNPKYEEAGWDRDTKALRKEFQKIAQQEKEKQDGQSDAAKAEAQPKAAI